jgi:hypothetical protein
MQCLQARVDFQRFPEKLYSLVAYVVATLRCHHELAQANNTKQMLETKLNISEKYLTRFSSSKLVLTFSASPRNFTPSSPTPVDSCKRPHRVPSTRQERFKLPQNKTRNKKFNTHKIEPLQCYAIIGNHPLAQCGALSTIKRTQITTINLIRILGPLEM